MLALPLLVAACTVNIDLTNQDHRDVVLPGNYQAVYRQLLTTAQRCFFSNAFNSSGTVSGQLYGELRLGEIVFQGVTGAVRTVGAKAQLTPASDSSTLLVIDGQKPALGEPFTDRIERYARGGEC